MNKYLFLIALIGISTALPNAHAQVFTIKGAEYYRDLKDLERSVSAYKSHLERIASQASSLVTCQAGRVTTIENLESCYGKLTRLEGYARAESNHALNIENDLKNLWGTDDSDVIQEQLNNLDSQSNGLLELAARAEELSKSFHNALVKAYVDHIKNSANAGYVEAQNKILCQRFSDRSLQGVADANLEFELGSQKSDLYEMIKAVRLVETLAVESNEVEKLCGGDYKNTVTTLLSARQNFYSKISRVDQERIVEEECSRVPKSSTYPLAANQCRTKSANASFTYWLHTLRK